MLVFPGSICALRTGTGCGRDARRIGQGKVKRLVVMPGYGAVCFEPTVVLVS